MTDKEFEKLQKAAEQGDDKAQYNLGLCYFNGEGAPQDFNAAVKWFRQAAKQGNEDAKMALETLK